MLTKIFKYRLDCEHSEEESSLQSIYENLCNQSYVNKRCTFNFHLSGDSRSYFNLLLPQLNTRASLNRQLKGLSCQIQSKIVEYHFDLKLLEKPIRVSINARDCM